MCERKQEEEKSAFEEEKNRERKFELKEEYFVLTIPFSHFNGLWVPFLPEKRESQLKEEFFFFLFSNG